MREIDPNLIRAYIDGELPPAVEREVRAAIDAKPSLRERVEFEKRMKSEVTRIMADAPPAPAGLSAAIRESIESEVDAASSTASSERDRRELQHAAPRSGILAALASLIEPIARPRPLSVGAVLAVLALAAGSVLFGIFYRPIDSRPADVQPNFVSDPAEYASQEHDRCASDPQWFNRKFNLSTPDEAATALTEHFGVESVTIFDLSEAGYEFIGEGRCNVPDMRYSAHLVYQRNVEGRSPAKLSIFIGAAGEERPIIRCGTELHPGQWHRHEKGSRCRKRVYMSTDNSLVYFLVTCDPHDAEPVSALIGRTLEARAR